MRRVLFICAVLATLWGANAQEIHRWTVGLSLSPGGKKGAYEDGYKLFPSIAYNINSWLSVGTELNLPLEDRGVLSSTGAELFVAFHSPEFYRFRFTLAPVFGASIIGAYKFSDKNSSVILGAVDPNQKNVRPISTLKHRWYVGLRPTLSYALSNRCSISLSYAMWGYRSHSKLKRIDYYSDTGLEDKGESGFTTNATYSSSIRLGFSYSF